MSCMESSLLMFVTLVEWLYLRAYFDVSFFLCFLWGTYALIFPPILDNPVYAFRMVRGLNFQGMKEYVKMLVHTYQSTWCPDPHSIELSEKNTRNYKCDSWLNVGTVWGLCTTDVVANWFDTKKPVIIQYFKTQC
jgi:hypothetical protein